MAQLTFKEQLERHGNEQDVRDLIAQGVYNGSHLGVAQEWPRKQSEERGALADSKRDAQEAEILAVAKEANDIARSASSAALAAALAASEANTISRSNRRVAISAAIIAAIAAIAAIIAAYAAIKGIK